MVRRSPLLPLMTVALLAAGSAPAFARQDDSPWRARKPLPEGRLYLGAASLGGFVYAFGGTDSASPDGTVIGDIFDPAGAGTPATLFDDSFKYDPVTDTWTATAKMSTPAALFGYAAYKGKIWAAGGCSTGGAILADVQAFDPVAGTWSSSAPLSSPRCSLQLAVLGDGLYAIGGAGDAASGEAASLETVEVFDGSSWSAGTPLPVGRSRHAATTVDGAIYVVGGEYDAATSIYRFKTDGSGWTKLSDLVIPGPGGSLVLVDAACGSLGSNRLFVFGGSDAAFGAPLNTVYRYDISGDAWTHVTADPLSAARFGAAGATHSDGIHVIGGAGADSKGTDAHDRFNTGPVGRPPSDPGPVSMFRKDNSPLPAGGFAHDGEVRFTADVTDPDNDTVRIDIQVWPHGRPAPADPTASGPFALGRAQVIVGSLEEGAYAARVRADDGNGNVTSWKDVGADPAQPVFHIDRTAPSAPVLSMKEGSSGQTDSRFVLAWTASTDPSPVTYRLQVSVRSDFSTTLLDVSGTWLDHEVEVPVGKYFSRVTAEDAAGNQSASVPLTFEREDGEDGSSKGGCGFSAAVAGSWLPLFLAALLAARRVRRS